VRKPRVIVCDDEDLVLDVFKHLFESIGYEVVTADTPVTCAFYTDNADSCPQHHRCTDILITDNQMPKMTGIELLELQHRKGCRLTSKNKILITGREYPELRKRAEALGCYFLPKPVFIDTILAWVKECEGRVDLSEPLAFELFSPVKQETLCVPSNRE
jgi:CheY-like chemotaxis protein